MRSLAMFDSKLYMYRQHVLKSSPWSSSYAGSVIMKVVYGYDVDADGDRFVELVDRGLEGVRIAGNVGTFLVDYIPSLKYLPREFMFL